MIRWRFVTIRVLVVAALLALFCWTAGPIVQWCAVRALQNSVGARVDIATTEIGLFPPRLRFTDVQIADPRKEMRNAFRAAQIELMIDGRALLQRRYEVLDGRISGIDIGGTRAESGRLAVVPVEPTEASGPSLIAQWSGQIAGRAEDRAREFTDGLQTVREVSRIRDHWESEYARLQAQTKHIEDEIRTLKSAARSIDNPLRDLPAMQDALRRAEVVRKQLIEVHQRFDALPAQIRSDLAALEQAKQSDRAALMSYLPADFNGSPAELGPELLGAMVRDQLNQVREYLESGRRLAGATVAGPTAERSRGETILIGGPRPSWLIQRCGIDGRMSANGDDYTVAGVVENVTSQTDVVEGPMRARLRLDGPRVVQIDYRRHYDNPVPRDHLRIHWPQLDLPAQRLGGRDASLCVDGGRLELWVDLHAVGDRIEGKLVSKQTGTRLDLVTDSKLQETVIVRSLRRSLADIDHVDVEATFAGSWRRVDMEVQTNLTSSISHGLKSAVQDQIAATRQRLAGEVQRLHDKQQRDLQEWLDQQQTDTRALLAKAQTAIDSANQKIAGELGAADAYLGRLRTGLGQRLK